MIESQRDKGFTIKSHSSEIDSSIKRKIARMSSLRESDVSIREVVYLVENFFTDDLRNNNYLAPLIKKYFGVDIINEESFDERSLRRLSEITQRLKQFVEFFKRETPEHMSFGIFAPSYIDAYKRIDVSKKDNNFRSLLVGALTIDTVLEYTALTKSAFPNSKTFTLDVLGEETRQTPDFIIANGLRLPFEENSLNLLQTNYLLHMLSGDKVDIASFDQRDKRINLFKEFFRVLKPGGQIVMVEGNDNQVFPGLPRMLIPAYYTEELKRAGFYFENIVIESASEMNSWEDAHRFFMSSAGVDIIDEFDIRHRRGTHLITAKK